MSAKKWREQQQARQRILTNDETYMVNVTRLNTLKHEGGLTPEMFAVHLTWLQRAALRRHEIRQEKST